MTCPQCNLENPVGTLICDCGYNFVQQRPTRHNARRADASWTTTLAYVVGFGLAASMLAVVACACLPMLFPSEQNSQLPLLMVFVAPLAGIAGALLGALLAQR
jgi:hypothetical protein